MYGLLIWAWTVVVIPMVAIIVFSVVIMIVGWCTPTEAAALGAASVIALAACYGGVPS